VDLVGVVDSMGVVDLIGVVDLVRARSQQRWALLACSL